MTATKIMLIRHAEKPPKSATGPAGVPRQTITRQVCRAASPRKALKTSTASSCRAGSAPAPSQATSPPRTPTWPVFRLEIPQVIFASGATKSLEAAEDAGSDGSDSLRPIETVTPLAAKLGLSLDTSWSLGGESKLVADAVGQTGVVLICWQHQAIPKIANLLCQTPDPVPKHWPVPQKWPGDRFDVVWIFDPPAAADGPWSFSQAPQNLLSGDQDSVIPPDHG